MMSSPMALRKSSVTVAHNYFTLWVITPSRDLNGSRPVDHLKTDPAPLLRALESFHGR